MTNEAEDREESDMSEPVRFDGMRDWVWSSRLPKIWWALATLFWAAKAMSSKLDWLRWLNEPGLAGYLTVAFFPPLMLLILGFHRLKQHLDGQLDGTCDSVFEDNLSYRPVGPSGLRAEIDPLDPRSGLLWSENALNPLNASQISHGS